MPKEKITSVFYVPPAEFHNEIENQVGKETIGFLSFVYKFEFGLHLAAVDLVSWIGHGFKKSYVDFCVVASGEIIC